MRSPALDPPKRVEPMQQRAVIAKNNHGVGPVLSKKRKVVIRDLVDPDENAAHLVVDGSITFGKVGERARQLVRGFEADPALFRIGNVSLQKAPQVAELLVLDRRGTFAVLQFLVQERDVCLVDHAGDGVGEDPLAGRTGDGADAAQEEEPVGDAFVSHDQKVVGLAGRCERQDSSQASEHEEGGRVLRRKVVEHLHGLAQADAMLCQGAFDVETSHLGLGFRLGCVESRDG